MNYGYVGGGTVKRYMSRCVNVALLIILSVSFYVFMEREKARNIVFNEGHLQGYKMAVMELRNGELFRSYPFLDPKRSKAIKNEVAGTGDSGYRQTLGGR